MLGGGMGKERDDRENLDGPMIGILSQLCHWRHKVKMVCSWGQAGDIVVPERVVRCKVPK